MTAIQVIAMSVWLLVNSGSQPLDIRHVLTDTAGYHQEWVITVAPQSQQEVKAADMPQIPDGFNGYLSLYARAPFSAYLLPPDYKSEVFQVFRCKQGVCPGGW